MKKLLVIAILLLSNINISLKASEASRKIGVDRSKKADIESNRKNNYGYDYDYDYDNYSIESGYSYGSGYSAGSGYGYGYSD